MSVDKMSAEETFIGEMSLGKMSRFNDFRLNV
jgi:hypothetical protein